MSELMGNLMATYHVDGTCGSHENATAESVATATPEILSLVAPTYSNIPATSGMQIAFYRLFDVGGLREADTDGEGIQAIGGSEGLSIDNCQNSLSEQESDAVSFGRGDKGDRPAPETLVGITDRVPYLAMSPAVGAVQLLGPMLRGERARPGAMPPLEAPEKSEDSGPGGMCGLCSPSNCRAPYCMTGRDRL